MNDGQFNMPHQFQRWQRVFKDRISRGTGYPQRRAVWRDADTVRRSARSAFGNTVSARFVGQLDSFNFGVLGKTYDGESVESFVEPSAFTSNAIGRTPLPRFRSQTACSLCRSTTVMVLASMEPETAYLPSGVT